MTYEQQDDRYYAMQLHRSHNAEMKLRRMAADAATRYKATRYAVQLPIMYHQRNDRLPLEWPRDVEVDLWPGITDHDARVLIAEEILRPQLRAAGWKV
jgi:hypothetical protein